MNNEQLWKSCLAGLEVDLPPTVFKTWFAGSYIAERQGSITKIAVRNSYSKTKLENEYYDIVKKNIDRFTKTKNKITFIVDKSPSNKADSNSTGYGPLFKLPQNIDEKSQLQSKYTFDNFVVGANNNLAIAVAQAVAENPGTTHNPFFLYSPVGLGKTHLVQAIANHIKKHHPQLKVIYCSGEDFTNQLIESIRHPTTGRNTVNFRKKFRQADVLIIDDIQFIAGRDSTQEEFFNTFNTLFLKNKQIILTSDRPPRDIAKLEERLSSRFASGMIADIQVPDVDVRLAIIQKKMESKNINIPNEILNIIAQRVTTNIRELEGVLNQVITTSQTLGQPPDAKLTNLILDRFSYPSSTQAVTITPKKVVKTVADFYQVSQKELKGKRRTKEIAQARQVTMYLLRTKAGCTLTEIGDILGGRDHSTVIHGVDKITKQREGNTKLQEELLQIETRLSTTRPN